MSNQMERVTAVFEAAVLLEPGERSSFVQEMCAGDSDLRRQVESMLADVDQPIVVDRPVDEAIADLMDDDRPAVIGRQFGPYRVESLLGVARRLYVRAMDRLSAIPIDGTDGAMSQRYPAGTGGRTYDVAPDGQRFLMIQQRDDAPPPPITHVVLVQNWLDELERLAPRK